ncbi:hypothetical protein PspLS_01006 [Pyricularia sp. CBS 133598]|nr:hypothetical protein PspLS_01006 [Pyricularia sp. CBS 133598]
MQHTSKRWNHLSPLLSSLLNIFPKALKFSGRVISLKFRSALLAIESQEALNLPPVFCPFWPSPVDWLCSELLEGRLCLNSVGVRNFGLRPFQLVSAVLDTPRVTSIISQDFANLLPASTRDEHTKLAAPGSTSVLRCIDAETNLERLEKIHRHLWLAGRPMPPRPLHYQRSMNRAIVVTEKMDMHLVWGDGRIYIKPLPRFILEPCFWTADLAGPSEDVQRKDAAAEGDELEEYRRRARGLLYTYAAMVASDSDFRIARDHHLLPEGLEWQAWRKLVAQLLDGRELAFTYSSMHPRFCYGELRLSRLDKICFYWETPLVNYTTKWNQYESFFRHNLGLLISSAGYVVVVLTALQVGLATDLKDNEAFQSASYGFTIFAILGPLAALGLILVAFFYLFINNWVATVAFGKKREKAMRHSGA